jgi:hypothetical protein
MDATNVLILLDGLQCLCGLLVVLGTTTGLVHWASQRWPARDSHTRDCGNSTVNPDTRGDLP